MIAKALELKAKQLGDVPASPPPLFSTQQLQALGTGCRLDKKQLLQQAGQEATSPAGWCIHLGAFSCAMKPASQPVLITGTSAQCIPLWRSSAMRRLDTCFWLC